MIVEERDNDSMKVVNLEQDGPIGGLGGRDFEIAKVNRLRRLRRLRSREMIR